MMDKILMIDNYDSFTYNLVHALESITGKEVIVWRNDEVDMDKVEEFHSIILSPGPGIPSEAGQMPALLKRYASTKKILGVCLGHQCIAENYGGSISNLSQVFHGVGTPIKLNDDNHALFAKLDNPVIVGRYHSWIVDAENLPDELTVLATDEDGRIMAMAHKKDRVVGVQFHPESVLTPDGNRMLENWIKM